MWGVDTQRIKNYYNIFKKIDITEKRWSTSLIVEVIRDRPLSTQTKSQVIMQYYNQISLLSKVGVKEFWLENMEWRLSSLWPVMVKKCTHQEIKGNYAYLWTRLPDQDRGELATRQYWCCGMLWCRMWGRMMIMMDVRTCDDNDDAYTRVI